MVRIRRSALPASGIFHITSRGVDRCRIYLDDDDLLLFASLFRRVVIRERLSCHAYGLMPNHFHAIIEGEMACISRAMHRIKGIHAQSFNERHGRCGHLFQDRFHAQLIRNDEHLSNAITYVLNNPVRHQLCANAGEWPWSGAVPARKVR